MCKLAQICAQVCMCVCVCIECVMSVCARGTIGIIISAWEAQLGGGGGAWLSLRGGVQQWLNHGLCVYRAEGWQVSAIIDYLHTATHACSRARNTEMYSFYCWPHWSPMPFLFLHQTHTHTHTVWACLQCISVSVSISIRGRDGKAPVSTSLWQKSGH